MQQGYQELKSLIKGQVFFDRSTLLQYATDASIYQILPELVVIPKDKEDVKNVLAFASENNINISPRGSATSLAGQAVNSGMIIDFTRYFDNIVSIDIDKMEAVVQPGVIRDQLNRQIAKHGLHFAPDPATTSRATFGGMIANNSSGTKSILYGMTSDHVIELTILLADGTEMVLKEKSLDDIDDIISNGGRIAEIYKTLRSVIFENTDGIKQNYPTTMRRVGGYALDAFVDKSNWNLCNLITGSEGTLAIILEAKIKLTPLPKFQNMCIVHFDDRFKSIQAVKHMVAFQPAAIEMLDFNVLSLSKENHTTKKYYEKTIVGDPRAVMTVEFYGQTHQEIIDKGKLLHEFLRTCPGAIAYPLTEDMDVINAALSLRKEGLGLIMGKAGKRKGVPFIEDSAIPLEHLADYIESVLKICEDLGVETILYAHASVGVLHVRPVLDLMDGDDIELMKLISSKTFDLVKKYGGSWSSEHGDGRDRSYKMKEFYGGKIYKAFQQLKLVFDPQGLLNANIILEALPMDQHLRYGSKYKDKKFDFMFKYRKQHSFETQVHNCSGVGVCRNHYNGTMCPSFRATGLEADSTRGRANVLRMAMSAQFNLTDMTEPEVTEVLDLCLSCKACKSECPSNVDMAKLKSEIGQMMHDKMGSTFSDKLVLYNRSIAKMLTGPIAPFINKIIQLKGFRSLFLPLMRFHKDRKLPLYASQSLISWHNKQRSFKSEKKVVLFADTYINYYETDLGKDAITLLNKCGYEVIMHEMGCCQRPAISKGFLKAAKKEGTKTTNLLAQYMKLGFKVVVIEPSCHSALTDDLADLIEDEDIVELLEKMVLPIEDFLVQELQSGRIKGEFIMKQDCSHLIHGHCHQKASYGTKSSHTLLKNAKAQFYELNSGCCGMAGGFGYEENHFEISKKIYDLSFEDKLKEGEAIIANGFSCRHQISDFSNHKAKHLISYLDFITE